MIKCLRCKKEFVAASKKAVYCSANCRKYAHAEKKLPVNDDVVTFLVLRSGIQVRPTDENVMRLFGGMISKVVWKNEMDDITRNGVVWDGHAVDPLKFDEVGQFDKVLAKKSLPSASSDDVSGDFVFPDGLDDVLVDYQKLYDECMFPDEYKALWERISADPNVLAKELPIWKIRLNVK